MTKHLSDQHQLPLCAPQRRPIPIDMPTLLGKPTYEKALEYVVVCGNFGNESELHMQLGYNAGNWTRIRQGKFALPWKKERLLEELCGNKGLTIWRAFQWGLGVHELQDTKDKRIAQLEAALAQEQKDRATIEEFVRRTRA